MVCMYIAVKCYVSAGKSFEGENGCKRACLSNFWIHADLKDPVPNITLVNDSPIVDERNVTIHLATNYDYSSLECRLDAPDPNSYGDGRYQNCKC